MQLNKVNQTVDNLDLGLDIGKNKADICLKLVLKHFKDL
jgi:hypothetical protein